MARAKKDRLGRGLGALLGEYLDDPEEAEGEIRTLRVSALVPNPFQPRREFAEGELAELAASIRENGLLQPLVARPAPGDDDRFELVAGERRLRAVRKLGWDEVAVVVREVDDRTLLILALVENIQREALGPLEEAQGYQALVEEFDLTQAQVAEAVGKSRSTVANTLRLLNLPPSVRRFLESGELSMGHARALLALDDAARAGRLARKAVREGWSVRAVEERVRKAVGGGSGKKDEAAPSGKGGSRKDPVIRALEERLQERLGTRVQVRTRRKGKGVIEVPFHSPEDFERLFALIAGEEASDVVG